MFEITIKAGQKVTLKAGCLIVLNVAVEEVPAEQEYVTDEDVEVVLLEDVKILTTGVNNPEITA
jgi:hypothetical protein